MTEETIGTLAQLFEASVSNRWSQVSIETAITRGQKKLAHLPLFVEKFLGSSWVQQLSDRQFRGYVALLQRLWDSDTPGFLPNQPDTLWRATGYAWNTRVKAARVDGRSMISADQPDIPAKASPQTKCTAAGCTTASAAVVSETPRVISAAEGCHPEEVEP